MGNKTGVKLQENCQGDTEAWCETAGQILSAGKLQENMLTLTGPCKPAQGERDDAPAMWQQTVLPSHWHKVTEPPRGSGP